MFALRLVSGFHQLGFLLVIRILSGKVRCAYRYENSCNAEQCPIQNGQILAFMYGKLFSNLLMYVQSHHTRAAVAGYLAVT